MPIEIYNSDNTIVIDHSARSNISPQERAKKAVKAGKSAVNVCCLQPFKAIKRALDFGLTKDELDIFLTLNNHALTDFGKSRHRIQPGTKVDIDELIGEIFDKATILDRQVLQNHFLKAVLEDINKKNRNTGFASNLVSFNEKFEAARMAFEQEQAKIIDVELQVSKAVVSRIFHHEYTLFKNDPQYPKFEKKVSLPDLEEIIIKAKDTLTDYHIMSRKWPRDKAIRVLKGYRNEFEATKDGGITFYGIFEASGMMKVIDKILPLLNLISKRIQKEDTPGRTKKLIDEEMATAHKKGWEFAFNSKDDYDHFSETLAAYFEGREYVLPEEVITLKPGCRKRLSKVLNSCYRKGYDKILKNDKKFFEIISVLSVYNDSTLNLYNIITKG